MSEVRASRPELRAKILDLTPVMFKEHIKNQVAIFFMEYDNKKLLDNSWYVSNISYNDFSVKIRGSGLGKFAFSVKEW